MGKEKLETEKNCVEIDFPIANERITSRFSLCYVVFKITVFLSILLLIFLPTTNILCNKKYKKCL